MSLFSFLSLGLNFGCLHQREAAVIQLASPYIIVPLGKAVKRRCKSCVNGNVS